MGGRDADQFAHITGGVKSVNDASRDAVSSETPLDGRQSTTASSGERVTHFLFPVTVRLDGHGTRHRCQ